MLGYPFRGRGETEVDQQQQNPPRGPRTGPWPAIQALLSLVIAGALIALAVAAFNLQQSTAMMGAAVADAVTATRASAQLESRPYLTAEIVQHRQDSDGHLNINFRVVNSGRTPALNVRSGYSFVLDDNFVGQSDEALLAQSSPALIAAGANREYILTTLDSSADMELLIQKDATFWLYGVVTYDDSFGGSHTSHFRFRYERTPLGAFDLLPTEDGNTLT